MNFNNFDESCEETRYLLMSGVYPPSRLSLVEEWAGENGLICSEQGLSDRFDEEIAPSVIEQYGVKGEAFSDDIAMNEAFNNWTDSLCKEGEIHQEQYDSYCYVGKWA